MKRMRICAAALLAALALCVPAAAAPSVSANCAILIDADTGRVLYEKNADTKSLIASTTKIMTGLLVAEDCDLEQVVSVPQEAVGIEGSSMYLKPDEQLKTSELLYGLMLQSGNDAAVALALVHSGNVADFVAAMNEKADKLGLSATHFANPNGLDDEGNYSTARDMAKLTAYALQNDVFAQVVSTKSVQVAGRSLTNHNKLLWQCEGADGVKTGYTKAAGRILVSSATRDGRQLIAVTITDPNDWQDHRAMFDFGFSAFTRTCVLSDQNPVANLPVMGGQAESCGLRAAEPVYWPVAEGEKVSLRVTAPHFLYAPVQAGEKVGEVEILVDGAAVAACPLYTETDVAARPEQKAPSFWERLFGG